MCEMDKSWMHADRRSKAYELGVEGFLNFAIWTWHREPLEWTTNASRNEEKDEQCGFSFVSEEVGMDDNDLGDIGFDPYEFANVIWDGDQPLYPGSSKYTMLSSLVKLYNLKAKHGMSDVCLKVEGRQRFNLERGCASEGGVVFSSNSKV
ncbi:unnamed protein product [Prunus armeniaca]